MGLRVGDVAASSFWSSFRGFRAKGGGGDDPGDCGSGGGRRQAAEEVGLTLRVVWQLYQLGAAAFRWRPREGGKGTRGEQTSPAARLAVSEYLGVQSGERLLRKTSALANQ